MGRQSSYLTSFGRTHCLRLPPPTEDAWNWQLRASCLGHPLEVFFPDDHARSSLRRREDAAKRICLQCPVVAECRDHALRTPEHHGIWGAMTAQERARELVGHGHARRSLPSAGQAAAVQ
jgi:WhiB family redox-sensing transcriptional regulator